MNGFEIHNQKHTSASSINLWSNAPDVWIAEKLFGYKGTVGPSAHRGNSVEYALVQILTHGVTIEEATEEAIKIYNHKTAFMQADAVAKERDAIAGCIGVGYNELARYGKPFFEADGKQHKVELLCNGDGWTIPIIGYLDLVYPDHGVVIDIKTTLRAPTEMSAEHNRQAAIYRRASGNRAVKFLYLTPKKAVWHECQDVDGTLAEIKEILTRQEHFLRQGTKEELAKLVHLDKNNFYWNGNTEAIKQVYG